MKVTLSNVTTGQNVSVINGNFSLIEDALNNGAFWRNNPVGEPNQLVGSNLDMNMNRIINCVIIIPSSASGLPSGAIYNDGSGFVRVVP